LLKIKSFKEQQFYLQMQHLMKIKVNWLS